MQEQLPLKNVVVGFLAILSIWITLISIEVYSHKQITPDVALVLSGDYQRIHFAVQLAKENKTLPIWISGTKTDLTKFKEILKKANIEKERFDVKLCAADTVTNFTCIVNQLSRLGVEHVLLITSGYHMARSLAIGNIVFGSRGIAITPERVVSDSNRKESIWRTARDTVRAIAWIFTGVTGQAKIN